MNAIPINRDEISFPTLGGRSPILKVEASYLRRAYYLTNALIIAVLLISFGYVKYRQWSQEQHSITLGKKVVRITYAQLGPPPSLSGEEVGVTPQAAAARPAAPTVGVPKPVPDAEAVQETAPTQQEISGTSSLTTSSTGDGSAIIVDEIPDINAFVPYEVEPKITFQPNVEYPEAAKRLGAEGTAFIKALVDRDGSVMRVVVLRSSGCAILDTSAVQSAYEFKFSPALQNNKPVRVWIMLPLRFRLAD